MQLRSHIHAAIADGRRLQRLLGVDANDDLEWGKVAEPACDGTLSTDEAAFAQCLAGLAGAGTEHFDAFFDRLDGQDQALIGDMLSAAAANTLDAEAHGVTVLEGK